MWQFLARFGMIGAIVLMAGAFWFKHQGDYAHANFDLTLSVLLAVIYAIERMGGK